MKRTLRTIRVLLDRHYLGNSINAYLVALAATAVFYTLYFGILIGLQGIFFQGATSLFWDDRLVTASVIFDFFALGLLWRYWTPARVVRFWLGAIRELVHPYWFAWRTGHRLVALSPILGMALFCSLVFGVATRLERKNRPTHTASVNQFHELSHEEIEALRPMSHEPCVTVSTMQDIAIPENR